MDEIATAQLIINFVKELRSARYDDEVILTLVEHLCVAIGKEDDE